MTTAVRPRSATLRFSHAVLAVAVIHQLLVSEWMAKPWKLADATAVQVTLFELHEWVGLTLAVLLGGLLFALARRYRSGVFGHFLPWLHRAGRKALAGELGPIVKAAKRLRPPTAAQTQVLAAAVQGIGLLTLLFFAVTGIAMSLMEDKLDLMHRIGSIHELGALPLKLYLLGHAGMALIHEWRGEGLVRQMLVPRQA
ncbi:cytochrome b/b6 domain-containing protein [Nevskia ramosa]|uniref:cytochrome b/b6 domain-containing protein n=1 Tax=Nevskia ramosa TaxID=64002 RepID=UPI003D0A689A